MADRGRRPSRPGPPLAQPRDRSSRAASLPNARGRQASLVQPMRRYGVEHTKAVLGARIDGRGIVMLDEIASFEVRAQTPAAAAQAAWQIGAGVVDRERKAAAIAALKQIKVDKAHGARLRTSAAGTRPSGWGIGPRPQGHWVASAGVLRRVQAATSGPANKVGEEEPDEGANGCGDDVTTRRSGIKTERWGEDARNSGTENANNDIADEAKTLAFDQPACEPSGDRTYNNPGQNRLRREHLRTSLRNAVHQPSSCFLVPLATGKRGADRLSKRACRRQSLQRSTICSPQSAAKGDLVSLLRQWQFEDPAPVTAAGPWAPGDLAASRAGRHATPRKALIQ